MKIGMKVEEHGSVSGPVIPSQDDFPWPHFASLALHKLINLWKLQPLLTNINLNDERSTSITLQPKVHKCDLSFICYLQFIQNE